MSVVIKGSEPFDVMIASNIVNCQTANIKFKNISFRCETIEDADGTVFVKMPSAQPEQQWIPCSERLPEEKQDVLLAFRHNIVVGFWEDILNDGGVAWYANSGDGWFTGTEAVDSDGIPAAWMPLPEPYKGGQDETDRC